IRSGQAVVASLHEARQVRPDKWGEPTASPNLVRIWHSAVRRSQSCVGLPNHAFVSYERLVADPAGVMRRLCAFLELPLDAETLDRMLNEYAAADAQARSGRGEPAWHGGVSGPIENRNTRKFQTLFTPEEQAAINRAVARDDTIMESFPFL